MGVSADAIQVAVQADSSSSEFSKSHGAATLIDHLEPNYIDPKEERAFVSFLS
jgi:hypothetical protein